LGEPKARLSLYHPTRFSPGAFCVTTKTASADVSRYALIAIALIALAIIVWKLVDVLLIAFGGIVVAAVLRAGALLLVKYFRWPEKLSLTLVIVLLLSIFGGVAWLFGDQILQQADQLRAQLPVAVQSVQEKISHWGQAGQFLTKTLHAPSDGSKLAGHFAKFAGLTAGFIAHLVVMLFTGFYLAFDPDIYVRGALRLFPPARRPRVKAAMLAAGVALKKWLVGQLLAMASIAILVGVGLSIAGVPLALALGALSGLLEFIPVLGPVLAAVPGVILAGAADPKKALYALIVYVVVQQFENHLIVPLTQRWSVKMPPALALLSIVTIGLLFGLLGVLLAMPIAVVVMVLIQKLYLPAVEGTDDESEKKIGFIK
jgi:predicted PurR-regulated permease PerM